MSKRSEVEPIEAQFSEDEFISVENLEALDEAMTEENPPAGDKAVDYGAALDAIMKRLDSIEAMMTKKEGDTEGEGSGNVT